MGSRRIFLALPWLEVGSAGGGAAGRREGPRQKRSFRGAALLATIALVASLAACGGSPPQIVDYFPQRGTIDVSTAVPIRITFDHDVDEASVESRLHLNPATPGTVHWVSGRQLVYQHQTLQPSTSYEVILDAGYRDLAGNVYTLRHHWAFVTEAPPSLVGAAPANGDRGVDPAAYLTLDFTRAMNGSSLASAITLYPTVPIDVRLDPSDGRRAIIAPSQLLAPNTSYQIAVNTAALDADGNQLDRDQTIDFTTGTLQALHGWITFAVDNPDGSAGGAWIVDAQGFPRRVYDSGPVHSFSWSPSGDRLLLEGADETWSDFVPGAEPVSLPFKGPWAAALAAGMGYVYIDESGTLHRLDADGADRSIASDVTQATVAANGLRVAFIESADPGTIWGYDVGLHARYELASDTGRVADVAWAPDGQRLAYLRTDPQTTATGLRVRSLTGSASTTTVATGGLSAPAWLPDSLHVLVAAAIPAGKGVVHKAFVINVVTPPAALTLAAGLPADPNVDVSSPVPSPDGHQIAFVSAHEIWLMNADGTRPTPLTKEDPATFPYSCRMPAWTRT